MEMVVGYRFYPTEEELLCYYLPNKLNGANSDGIDRVIPLLNIYDYNPWDLPQVAGEVCRGDTEQWQWFFFLPMQERESHGGRPNRLTKNGYWKATGSPNDVYTCQNLRVGRKKTMVFYEGRAPNGRKTAWKMNEYKLYQTNQPQAAAHPQLKEELSLCRIYKRSKCTRIFDRRPQTEAAVSYDQAAEQYYHHLRHGHNTTDEAAVTIDNQQNPSVEENEIDWEIAPDEIEPLSDSDIVMLLDWFDI